ncbi:MAG: hypothetical protein ACR2MG_15970 [Pyrinomonadaceae bacterium]
MSKILLFILGAVLGLVIGGVLVLYFFGGAPRATAIPGNPIQPPDANGIPAGTATVVLNQQFFDTILGTIFRDMNAPAFPLNLTGRNNFQPDFQAEKIAFQQNGGCEGKITLLPEGSGVKTGVRLEDGKITAPLAFQGSTSLLGNCINFAGWAQANFNLRYDETQQTVFGQIDVQTVNLDGITPLLSGVVTPIVQTTLNNRVNPVTILRGQQIALNLPIAATEGTLNAKVKDIRADIKENALNFYVTYDFAGTKVIQPTQ